MTFGYYPISSLYRGMKNTLGGLLTLVLGGALGIAAANFCLYGLDMDLSRAWAPFQGPEMAAPATPAVQETESTGREPMLGIVEAAIQSLVIVYCVYTVIAAFVFYGMFWKDWPRPPVFFAVAALQLTVTLIQSSDFRFESVAIVVRTSISYAVLAALFIVWFVYSRREKRISSLEYLEESSEILKKF
jgi:hypothetical protein